MKKLIVWLDDFRDPSDYGLPDALWLKNSSEFMDLRESYIDAFLSGILTATWEKFLKDTIASAY